MKTTITYALAAVLIVAIGVLVSAGNVTLSIPFNCDAEYQSGDLDFDAAAQAPAADSSGGNCGMFWSNTMYMTLHANADACWTVQCTDFIHQVNSAWTLTSSVNPAPGDCGQYVGWSLTWLITGGTASSPPLKIGVVRSGYADHAGTYISTITIACSEC